MCFGLRPVIEYLMSKNYFKIRNYRPGDFDNYIQLHMEINKLDRSRRSISKQRLAEDLGHPSFHPENDLFVAEHGGSIIGYAAVFLEAAIKRAILECMIHPLHRKKGIATELIRRAIRHAEAAESEVVQVCVPQINLPARNLASHLGLKFIRHFYELKLDLNNVRLPDVEPREYIIRGLGRDEADKLTHIQNRAFADSWGFNPNTLDEIAYRISLSSCSPENIMMAYLENRPIGYCWTRILIEDKPAAGSMEGEIHMLGVDPDFRKKGIGRTVLLAGLADLKSKGVTIVKLTVNGEDPVALGLYESVGFEVCSRTEWFEKKLAVIVEPPSH
jgi:mycothiol synthase